MELVDFLRARLDEDETVAREAGGESWPMPERVGYENLESVSGEVVMYGDSWRDDMGPHIARHDPARVLADVEAKRRIVDRYAKIAAGNGETTELAFHEQGLFEAVLYLASAYAYHPDYSEEWKP